MHKTQGLGNFAGFGGSGANRHDSFQLLAGEPATNDIMDGVNTSWSRVPGCGEIGALADDVIAKFNPQDPGESVPALLQIRKRVDAIDHEAVRDPVVAEKWVLLNHIIAECLGLTVQTTIPEAEVVPGEALHLHMTTTIKSDIVRVRWIGSDFPASASPSDVKNTELSANAAVTHDSIQKLPINTLISQPYWLREPHTAGMFQVDNPNLIGRPENFPVFPIEQVFLVDGQSLIVPDQPVQATADRAKDEPRDLTVISPVTLKFTDSVELFAPSATRTITVSVTSARSEIKGTLQLVAPDGWNISPKAHSFSLIAAGDQGNSPSKSPLLRNQQLPRSARARTSRAGVTTTSASSSIIPIFPFSSCSHALSAMRPA